MSASFFIKNFILLGAQFVNKETCDTRFWKNPFFLPAPCEDELLFYLLVFSWLLLIGSSLDLLGGLMVKATGNYKDNRWKSHPTKIFWFNPLKKLGIRFITYNTFLKNMRVSQNYISRGKTNLKMTCGYKLFPNEILIVKSRFWISIVH